ncbi:hypothetical protein RBB50_006624 [Rhinocladiella similis]
MASRSTWIERGPDGRPYFVRSKEKLPSARQLLAEVLFPRRTRSLFVRESHQISLWPRPLEPPAPRNDPPDIETPNLVPTPGPSIMPPTSQSQPQPVNMYLMPAQQQDNEHPPLQGPHSMAVTQQNPQFPPPFVPHMPFLPPHIPPTFPLPSLQQPVVFGMPPAAFPPPQAGLANGVTAAFSGPGVHSMPIQVPELRQPHTPAVPQSRAAELRYKSRAIAYRLIGLFGRLGAEHQDQDPAKQYEEGIIHGEEHNLWNVSRPSAIGVIGLSVHLLPSPLYLLHRKSATGVDAVHGQAQGTRTL